MAKVQLSVAIIFRNEIRCLERCLRSIQPLKERISCEIVMADTGATDGSRAVAEKYADLVFDFPWIDDFAAARNAVLDRCSGRWVLVMDCDEWLDPDVRELVSFVTSKKAKPYHAGSVTIRNYFDAEFSWSGEIAALRVLRLSGGLRYVGSIHEQPRFRGDCAEVRLDRTILHHDGYVMLNDDSEAGQAKYTRNVALLRTELEKEPKNADRWLQMIESARREPDYQELVRRAVLMADEHRGNGEWNRLERCILREAVYAASDHDMPELDEWADRARTLYPDSYFTRIDIDYELMTRAVDAKDDDAVLALGEAYLKARADYGKDPDGQARTMDIGILQKDADRWEALARAALADVYVRRGDYEKALAMLKGVVWESLNEKDVKQSVFQMWSIYSGSTLDIAPLLRAFWSGIRAEKPNAAAAERRERAFVEAGMFIFGFETIQTSVGARASARDADWRSSDLFLPLAGRGCILGDAAALLRAQTPEEADDLLADVDDLAALPTGALLHALKLGAAFPIPGRPLPIDQADALAARLTVDMKFLRDAAVFAAFAAENDQDIVWADALARAAFAANDWKTDDNPLPLIRAFVRAESAFLSRYYTKDERRAPEVLLPAHRFGLHLANAFAVIAPNALAPDFEPTVSAGVRGALDELRAAAQAVPEYGPPIRVVLDTLS